MFGLCKILFQNMIGRFDLKKNDFTKEKFIHYFIYSLEMDPASKELKLNLSSRHSYTTWELKEAFNENRAVPSLEVFINNLQERIKPS